MAFEIDLLPVGSDKKSGDCIAMRYGDLVNGKSKQTVIIVDGGYAGTWQDTLKPHLKKYYNCEVNGKLHIDLVILSHPDQDHVSGLVEMAKDNEVEVGMIMMHRPWKELTPFWFKDGRITKDSLKDRLGDAFEKAKELADATSNIRLFNLEVGTYTFREASITILGPTSDFYKTCIANCEKTPQQGKLVRNIPQTQGGNGMIAFEPYVRGKIKWDDSENTSPINESSLIILFEYEGAKVLLTGDAGKEGLSKAIKYAHDNNIKLNDCSIIKMPHHGSRKNVNPTIMDAFVGSRALYYSCASNDLGHHPSQRLINLMNEKKFKQFSTSGSTLHWGKNAPDRGWKAASVFISSDKIEK